MPAIKIFLQQRAIRDDAGERSPASGSYQKLSLRSACSRHQWFGCNTREYRLLAIGCRPFSQQPGHAKRHVGTSELGCGVPVAHHQPAALSRLDVVADHCHFLQMQFTVATAYAMAAHCGIGLERNFL